MSDLLIFMVITTGEKLQLKKVSCFAFYFRGFFFLLCVGEGETIFLIVLESRKDCFAISEKTKKRKKFFFTEHRRETVVNLVRT